MKAYFESGVREVDREGQQLILLGPLPERWLPDRTVGTAGTRRQVRSPITISSTVLSPSYASPA